jgi:hypothetical protein
VVTLALGIGANTAIFSMVKAALLEAPPYRMPALLSSVAPAGCADPARAAQTYFFPR